MRRQKQQFNFSKLALALLRELPHRSRDVISRRYGLETGEKETLEQIGHNYNITRERVRQIEREGLRGLKNSAKLISLKPVFDFVKRYLERSGGVAAEEIMLNDLTGKAEPHLLRNSLFLLLNLNPTFKRIPENTSFKTVWFNNESYFDRVQRIIEELVRNFQERGDVFAFEEISDLIRKTYKDISPKVITSYLSISKRIDSNNFGELGLKEWPLISPRGVKDKAYLVLRKEKNPLHFTKITELINQSNFSPRKAYSQTVHNELIKDDRFVLVGRGIYGLAQWGYRAGTVKDILIDLLKEHSEPMDKRELVKEILKSKIVKENTILLNLQDSQYFRRTSDGRYCLTSREEDFRTHKV